MPDPIVTPVFAAGLMERVLSWFHWLDELGIFGAGAVLGPKIASFFKKKKFTEDQLKTIEQAVQLHREGKAEEAGELIFKSNVFFAGKQDEALMFFAQIWMIQWFSDCGTPDKAELIINAIDGLDDETKRQLEETFAQIEKVEEAGQMLASLADLPNLNAGIKAMCRNACITVKPEDHPANVLVDAFDGAFTRGFGGYAGKLKTARTKLRRKAARAARRRP